MYRASSQRVQTDELYIFLVQTLRQGSQSLATPAVIPIREFPPLQHKENLRISFTPAEPHRPNLLSSSQVYGSCQSWSVSDVVFLVHVEDFAAASVAVSLSEVTEQTQSAVFNEVFQRTRRLQTRILTMSIFF